VPAAEAAPRPLLLARLAEAPVTVALVAANVAVLALVARTGSATDPHALVRFGAVERGHLWAGEWWRLVAATFLHWGWFHLAWNAAAALLVGRPVERALGPARFAAVYLASGVAGAALSALGQDAISVGASGALNGLLGAVLVLHALALGSLRAFVRSPGTLLLAALLAGWAAFGLAARLPIDHLAHLGGLVAGAALTLALSLPRRRAVAATAAVAAGIALLCGAAVWPRSAPTRWEAVQRTERIDAALRREDVAEAKRLLAEAAARGQRSPALEYYRAFASARDGDYEGALEILRPVVDRVPEGSRADARALAASLAKNLGYRFYTGEGARRDPRLGLSYLEEACGYDDAESCRNAAAIRGDAVPGDGAP
jgi:rhomboid protease GluP